MAEHQANFSTSALQVGDVVGPLRILDITTGNRKHFECECLTCGRSRRIRSDHMIRYVGKECQCSPNVRHGQSRKREYAIWSKMLNRCYRVENDNYRWYGGLGKYVCERWRNSVIEFIADMGSAPSPKHTLDRIDTNGSYTCGKCEECQRLNQPFNCRWATKDVQVRNAKNNRWYTHNGQTLILKDWARLAGMNYLTLHHRIELGWSFEDAITKPVRPLRKHK